MILEDSGGKAITNANNVHVVKIEANAVMFDLLSSRLYSDKPMAVLRELSTNAIDAQIASGFTGQFKVHLPTRLEPYVTIRDFGTGMDKDTVIDLYGTMGASSKRDSNAYNGALGVGSKSPFAYTSGSAFTVTSYYNNEKTTYSVFADNGIPSIAELGSMSTDEPNGLEVSVPVHASDIQKFTDSALKLYKYFTVKPEVNMNLGFELGNVLYEGTGWKIYDKSAVPVVVMANVAYPLDRQQINGMQALQSQGLVIYADTGAVQFAASREALSYTPSTIDYLKKINAKVVEDLTEYVKEIPRKFEGKLLEMQHNLASLPSFLRNIAYRQDIHKYIEKSSYFEIHNHNFKWLIPESWNARNNSYTEISFSKLRGREIILADSLPAANAVAQTNKDKSAILAFTAQRTLGTKTEAMAKMKEFADLLGVPYKIASEESLKLFGTTVATSKGSVATSITYRATGFKYDPKSTSNYCYIYNNDITVSAKDKAITIGIPIYNGKFHAIDYETPMDFLYQDIWNILKYVKYPTAINVVAIPKTHKEHLQNTIDLYTFLKTLGTLEIDVVTQKLISELLHNKNYSHSYLGSLQLPQDFKDYIKEVDELNSKPQEQYSHQVISSANKIGVPTKVKELWLTAKAKEAHERYKPLNICTINNDITKQQHFVKLANALSKDK